MLGLLRLATNAKVMDGRPFTTAEVWKAYRDFLALPEVSFLAEDSDVETHFAAYSEASDFPVSHWTDAYLAAFVHVAGCRLVSFDSDFHRFPGLEFLHLRIA